jgi:APA family basic amino acid/polyamine antiporter
VAAVAPGPFGGAALWVAGGVVSFFGALVYAECGARLPHDGGFYVFYRRGLGETWAFVGGAVAFLVTYPASVAGMALIFEPYLDALVPGAAAAWHAPAIAVVVVAGAVNVAGLRSGPRVQRVLTTAKVACVAAVCVAALWGGAAPPAAAPAGAPVSPAFGALVMALVGILWTFSGWSDVTLVAGEIERPERNLVRTVFFGTAVLVALYALVQVAVVRLLPAGAAAGSTRVFADAVRAGFGEGWHAAECVSALVVLSTAGAINGVILACSRLGFAMAHDRVLPAALGSVHARFGTPARAVWALTALSLVYVVAADLQRVLSLFTFSVWGFYALTAVALLRLRREGVGGEGVGTRRGGLVASAAPWVLLAASAGIEVSLLSDPRERHMAAACLVVLAVLFAGRRVWRRGRGAATG